MSDAWWERDGFRVPVRPGVRVERCAAVSSDVIRASAAGRVKTGESYDGETLTGIPGGLFDPRIFGELDGVPTQQNPETRREQWGYLELPFEVDHPFAAGARLRALPVLPPAYRLFVKLSDGRYASADLNYHYREVASAALRCERLSSLAAPEGVLEPQRARLRAAVRALFEGGRVRERDRRGLLQAIQKGRSADELSALYRACALDVSFVDERPKVAVVDALDEGLTFQILEAREDAGWTRLDCEAKGAHFTLSLLPKEAATPLFQTGEFTLAAASRGDGAKLLRLFGKAFNFARPGHHRFLPLKPLHGGCTFFRRGEAEPGRVYPVGQAGSTKLTAVHEGNSAELRMYFSITEGRGAFGIKDSLYAEPLGHILAFALRDGLRPPKSPENDRRRAHGGPKFGRWEEIGSAKKVAAVAFTPSGRGVLIHEPSGGFDRFHWADVERPRERVELVKSPRRMLRAFCVDEAARDFIFYEPGGRNPDTFEPEDPSLWRVRGGSEREPFAGPWDGRFFHLKELSQSPDGRYLFIESRGEGWLCVPREGRVQAVQVPADAGALIAWRGGALLFERRRLALETLAWTVASPEEAATLPSPHGKHTARLHADAIEIDGARYVFEERERKHAKPISFRWLDDDWLQMYITEYLLLDGRTAKASSPLPEGYSGPVVDPSFTRVVAWGKDGVFLGHVELTERA